MLGHGVWPHGADWLHEAAAETYVPFLHAARRLLSDGVPFRATVGITPVLCEQLRDPRFPASFRAYLKERIEFARQDARRFGAEESPAAEVARFWRQHYRDVLATFDDELDRDVVGGFRHLAATGAIEPISCAATHGFLPLLPTDGAIERQLDVGLAAHERHFGRRPRGIWLPECAYRPAGSWVSPADGRTAARCGLERFLLERDVRFTFVETHLVSREAARSSYGGRPTVLAEGERTPYRPVSVAGTGGRLAVFGRDPRASEQVWSGEVGYPGEAVYLEFHRKHAPGGLRYWSVTDSKGPLDRKVLYDRTRLPERIASHAEHFAELLAELPAAPDGRPLVVTAMFDFELFGHWWFEGIDWLEALFRTLHARYPQVRPATAPEALAAAGALEEVALPAGSWGKNGDYRVWWNDLTRDYWQAVDRAEELLGAIGRDDPSLLPRARRQLLLLESSDWPFLVENGSARDYAEARIERHAADLEALARIAAHAGRRTPDDLRLLAALDDRDRLFGPELEG